jgi:neutral trehalase
MNHTYQDYVKAFLSISEKALRNYYKKKAKKRFPKEFDKNDFPRKKNVKKYSYGKYKEMFTVAENAQEKAKAKFRAKEVYPDLFDQKDFSS